MNNNDKTSPEQLFTIYFDGSLSPGQRQQLVEWLKANKSHIKQFVYASYIHRGMYDILYGQDTHKIISRGVDTEGVCADDFWKALLEEEKNAPSVELEQSDECKPDVIVPDRSQIQVTRGHINRFAWGTAFASLAAFFFLLMYVHLNPRPVSEPVAAVSDVIKVQSHDWDPALRPGVRLLTRDGVYRVGQGLAKIQLDNGVHAVIEGPGEFELISYDEIALHSGRLFASVPRRSVGFIVSTSNAKVIDLGTEFGVYADGYGDTEIHVLDGRVSLVSGMRADVRHSQVVSESQACRVRGDSETIEPIDFHPTAFARDINSKTRFIWRGQPLDLADIAGGGNGLGTGRLNVCIDVATGRLREDIPRARIQLEKPYVATEQLPFVDGLFIPDGRNGPIEVTSEGHLYEAPATLGETYYGVFNGSVLPLRTGDNYVDHPVQFRGTIYGTSEQPALMLHSNLGVTFDLQAIRKTLPPGRRITGFSARCGIAEGPLRSRRDEDYSDFFVLVDGVERFRAVDMNYLSEMRPVKVELTDNDRFLTLMTTDGRDGTLHLGWSFFAEPQLTVGLEHE